MTAIYAAFNRHGIACANPLPANSGGSAVVTGLTLSGAGGAAAVAPLSYRVQGAGANAAHESRVTNCVTASAVAVPRPVPQLTASRVDATTITVSWDAATCPSPGGYASGTTSWSAVPAGNGSGTEASWGQATIGPRNGTTASGQCGNTSRSNAASCP